MDYKDFSQHTYKKLIEALQISGYAFQPFEEFLQSPKEKVVVLRHDIDLKAKNALQIAQIEHNLGIKASYYFRVVPQSNKPEIIKAIVALGHEIGYHYEDVTLCKGNMQQAIHHFEKQLQYFRQFYPVKTVCMHGSPTSKYDNRTLWQQYNYKDVGLIGEPYFDVDFTKVFYLTDTGRCWDGERYSVRDKVKSSFTLHFHTTDEIIIAAKAGKLPKQVMITTHPQRWTTNLFAWAWELVLQSAKNQVKRVINCQ